MQLLKDYFNIQKLIYEYFDYCEDWQVFPIEKSTQYYWALDGEGPGTVMFADTETELHAATGNFYIDQIYTYRNLSKWVYRGEMYTMIVVDTQTDGNKFLRIFDNAKERKLQMTNTNNLMCEQLSKATNKPPYTWLI